MLCLEEVMEEAGEWSVGTSVVAVGGDEGSWWLATDPFSLVD